MAPETGPSDRARYNSRTRRIQERSEDDEPLAFYRILTFPLPRVLKLIEQACSALDFAHPVLSVLDEPDRKVPFFKQLDQFSADRTGSARDCEIDTVRHGKALNLACKNPLRHGNE